MPLYETKNKKWTENEETLLLESYILFGPNWKCIKEKIKSRSCIQIRCRWQKILIKSFIKYRKFKENTSLSDIDIFKVLYYTIFFKLNLLNIIEEANSKGINLSNSALNTQRDIKRYIMKKLSKIFIIDKVPKILNKRVFNIMHLHTKEYVTYINETFVSLFNKEKSSLLTYLTNSNLSLLSNSKSNKIIKEKVVCSLQRVESKQKFDLSFKYNYNDSCSYKDSSSYNNEDNKNEEDFTIIKALDTKLFNFGTPLSQFIFHNNLNEQVKKPTITLLN